jgi:archaellum component FlaF (FlaF/FlaG flagellin family)
MKEPKEKLDSLLEHNADEQLARVDWNELNTAISKRLDKAESNKLYARKYPVVFKVAAGIAVAAALIFIAVMFQTKLPPTVKFEDHGNAMVRFVDKKGVAMVDIQQISDRSQVIVDFEDNARKVAKCDIKIIDSNGDLKKESDQPMWIIISKSEPTVADNGHSSDEADMALIYLL